MTVERSWRGLEGLSAVRWAVLDALSTGRLCTRAHLLDRMQAVAPRDDDRFPTAVRLVICRLHKQLRPLGIEIACAQGLGYQLDQVNAERLAARLIR